MIWGNMQDDIEHAIRAYDRNRQASDGYRKAALESANIAIRPMILVNGGAVVALLAFVSALASSGAGNAVSVSELAAPIRWFALGVGLSVFLAALSYLVNLLDSDISNCVEFSWTHPYVTETAGASRLRPLRTTIFVLALIVAVGVLVMFAFGILDVTKTILLLG